MVSSQESPLPRRRRSTHTLSSIAGLAALRLRQSPRQVTALLGLLALTFFIGRVMPLDPVLSWSAPTQSQSTYQQVYRPPRSRPTALCPVRAAT